ncbi:MAG TPA: tetratricopeptide repeat protein, partial [Bryobacteraceae bacterium]|nr:tetratricopeptide repeat protein [Bryobacteraceae bacterium]
IASLLIYARWPALRSRGVYAIPVVPAMLFKPSAVMIAGVVIAYAVVVERANRGKLVRECLPVVLATAAMLGLIAAKTPASHTTGGTAFANYVATQPRVAMHYVSSFVAPLALSVDTDRKPVDTLTSDTALIGYVFLAGLLWVTLLCSRQSAMRPAGFGLWLFLIALLPTSLVPLAEVENDHRMFAAFLGLAMAVTWSAWRCLETLSRRALALRLMQRAAVLSAALILSAAAFATHERNEVWRTEESLWLDATLKSPGNGRAHMNYALTQMQKGQYERALVSFNKALQLTPNYPILEINLGIVHGELGRRSEAEQQFRRALARAPSDSMPLFYFGRWLRREARVGEAEQMLRASIGRNTLYAQPRELLLDLYRESSRWSEVKALALDTLQYLPDNRKAGEALAVAARPPAAPEPTPEQLLQLSLVHHQGRRFKQCIDAARQALRLRPNFPEAYNNIAAAYEGLEMWDEAIEAARQALKLRPDYTLARNNLLYSQSQKSRAAAQRQSD